MIASRPPVPSSTEEERRFVQPFFILVVISLIITYVYSMWLYRQLHPGAMEPPAPLAMPTDGEPDSGEPAAQLVPSAPLPQGERIEVLCPSCGAENAPGNRERISCGKPLSGS